MKKKTAMEYIEASAWRSELQELRSILLSFDLEERVKWGTPHYLMDGKILIGLAGFKSYFGLWFHQGSFLSDPENILVNAQEGKTRALRQWRFQSSDRIDSELIRKYVAECIQNHKDGKSISPRQKKLVIPEELSDAFQLNKDLQQAFKKLSDGQQREYAEYINTAKQQATKQRRLEKSIPLILDGQGLNDQYK